VRGDSGEAHLTITERTGDGDGGEPSITVDPGSAAPGDDVTIGGDNFGPDETIAVEVTDKDGNGIDTSLLRYPVVLGELYIKSGDTCRSRPFRKLTQTTDELQNQATSSG
jgi:hypothetical protein